MAEVHKLPGHKVDVKLRVFSHEIHCHSLMLKLGSVYFRKFLDSADKTPSSANATFKYEYVTIQDTSDDVPSLEVASKVEGRGDKPVDTGSDHWYIAVKHMTDCIQGCGFYGALPVVSRSLDTVFFRSPKFIELIPDNAGSLLKIAYQLRNRTLYRECMIHVAGRWKRNPCISEDDMDLRIRVLAAYGSICDKLVTANFNLAKFMTDFQPNDTRYSELRLVAIHYSSSLAVYFRRIYDKHISKEIDEAINKVLASNLILDPSKLGAGQGRFQDYFLCAKIIDKELPWDEEYENW
ncbi:uncharacterized protein EAF01_005905 [Botrytis porri]|uniref:BTB domain-containing protein n=1 Tax=Botrytis porri TaxID=87229 RepID=A0A4Z1L6I4_9HELO|nr:uncharacterized protein EAF01_005905 [Botrytis porri]KAF7905384.1 hypothetical protein EAF01_005905 [Botrytis porri]TGO92328.1 hypothetical protein BPOR_0005g00170 [Botrytis porri]